jgi:hypothetical protein
MAYQGGIWERGIGAEIRVGMALKPTMMFARPVFVLLVTLAIPALGLAATPLAPTASTAAQPTVEQKTPAPPAPVSIPAPEIAKRAEEVAKLLRDFDALTASSPAFDEIQGRLPEVSARLAPESESTIETLKYEPTSPVVERMTLSWQTSRLELAGWVEVLTKRATQFQEALDRLAGVRATWTETRKAAQASSAPAEIVQRVEAVLADVEAMRAQLQAQRDATLACGSPEACHT